VPAEASKFYGTKVSEVHLKSGLHMAATRESPGLLHIGLAKNGASTFDIALHADVG
jgi:hypothetical protein